MKLSWALGLGAVCAATVVSCAKSDNSGLPGGTGGGSSSGGTFSTGGVRATGGSVATGGSSSGGTPGAGGTSGASPSGGRGGSTPLGGAGGAGGARGTTGPGACGEVFPPPKNSLGILFTPSLESGQVRFVLALENASSEAVDLSSVTIRYWFTNEGDDTPVLELDYVGPDFGGRSNVTGSFEPADGPGADTYLEFSFESGSLAAGETANDLQVRLHTPGYAAPGLTPTNDCSHLAEGGYNGSVTVYVDGVLVWGAEPGSLTGGGGAGGSVGAVGAGGAGGVAGWSGGGAGAAAGTAGKPAGGAAGAEATGGSTATGGAPPASAGAGGRGAAATGGSAGAG